MSSPPGSPGAAAWRMEAEGVVSDIAPHVSSAALSSLPGGSSGAYINITTLEGRRLTVRLSAAGFSVCGDGHDTCATGDGTCATSGGRVYETPYALLHDVSPAYTAAFGQSLSDRLSQLADEEEDSRTGEEEDAQPGEESEDAAEKRIGGAGDESGDGMGGGETV